MRLAHDLIERAACALEARREARAIGRLAARPAVTVVVPIYGAAPALRRCLRAVTAAARAGDACELLLIDDHSPGTDVAEVCASFAVEHPSARVLRNERNLGFVASVNRGMTEASADNDIVLLNSDTEVTPGWLRRLSVAAYLDERTATVCPLSNAAGVFSIPRAHEDRELPEGFTARECQRALSWVSERTLEEVPTTSGFCMFIKRRVIEAIGRFDSSLFLRGYGEENDFNERASKAGFHHRVDDSRLVYHARGLSFGSGKAELKRKNARILAALHPEHLEKIRAWERTSELDRVRGRYASLLEALARVSPADRARALEDPTIVVGDAAPSERKIVVRPREDHVEVDLFGVRTVEARLALDACLFELVYRWEPSRIVASGVGLVAARSVGAIFGVPVGR